MTTYEGEIVTTPVLSQERAHVLAAVMDTARLGLASGASPEQRQDALAGLHYLAQLICQAPAPSPYPSAPSPAAPPPSPGDVIDRLTRAATHFADKLDARRRPAPAPPPSPDPRQG